MFPPCATSKSNFRGAILYRNTARDHDLLGTKLNLSGVLIDQILNRSTQQRIQLMSRAAVGRTASAAANP